MTSNKPPPDNMRSDNKVEAEQTVPLQGSERASTPVGRLSWTVEAGCRTCSKMHGLNLCVQDYATFGVMRPTRDCKQFTLLFYKSLKLHVRLRTQR